MGSLRSAIRANSGRYSGASSGRPATFVYICTPVAPRSSIARSISRSAASGLFIGNDATKLGKRSGWRRTISVMLSFAIFARSGVTSGPPMVSMGGLAMVSTCT